MKKKINVCIVFGGKTEEHEVSINSAHSIFESIDKEKYSVSLLEISKAGNMNFIGNKKFGNIDVFFPIIHGTNGEDGSLQGFFEILGVPYVGAGILGSAIGMDKDIMKRLLIQAGFKTPRFLTLRKNPSADGLIDKFISTVGYPVFIKPANMGSSIGISKAGNSEELKKGMLEAFQFDSKILIEEFIHGDEIEISILGNDYPKVSLPCRVIPKHEFYTYNDKYYENGAYLEIPAKLNSKKTNEIQTTALKVYKILECSGMARLDFFLKPNGELYINEINTLPGFTKTSVYPKLWEASGLPYCELIDQLINLALKK